MLKIDETALLKIEEILKQNNEKLKKENKLNFRVEVTSGGCSGFQYKFSLDSKIDSKTDSIIKINDHYEIVVDNLSLQFLAGSTLIHINNLSGQYFEIRNPNAKTRCGCGSSFSF